MSDYPEHDKLSSVKDASQAIGEFIDFGGYVLAKVRDAGDNGEPAYLWRSEYEKRRAPTTGDYLCDRAVPNPDYESWGEGLVAERRTITQVLAEYFEIDLDKIEAEKRAMLDALQQQARVRAMDEGNREALRHIAEFDQT